MTANADLSLSFEHLTATQAHLICLSLAVAYVGSLYVNKLPLPRDHPLSIKQRFRRVFVVSVAAPLCLWMISANSNVPSSDTTHVDQKTTTLSSINSLLILFGIHTHNLLLAIILPLLLTVILFLGPVVLELTLRKLEPKPYIPFSKLICELTWQRTFVVAPFTEEFVFRACMLPLLVPHLGLKGSIIICPLFFGVAHVHHVLERIQAKEPWLQVWGSALFQMIYTTIFGAYSAFLFLRTGHLIGPVVCHSFCNQMGFPEFDRISDCSKPKFVLSCFILGLVLFCFLIMPLTEPKYFHSIYWN